MRIKDLDIDGITFLAPLAGITNLPFRRLIKACGCSVVCSEMVSAKGIFYNSEKTLRLLETLDQERPLSVQIFGSDPGSMARAAAFIQESKKADILDINFGCSVKKVVKQGAGVALMKDPATSREILRAVRKAVSLPFTIKIRSGWDSSGRQAFDLAQMAQDEGVDAIALHPRTAGQAFRGCSDWNLIRELKERVQIPVIGNGDIHTPEDAEKMLTMTGCDGIMVGRAALGNPFIFSQIETHISQGRYQTPTPTELFAKMEDLINLYVDYFGEKTACAMLRGRLSWFVKGLPGSATFRKSLSTLDSAQEARNLIRAYLEKVG